MTPALWLIVLVSGAAVAGGLIVLLAGLRRTPPHLVDALAVLAGSTGAPGIGAAVDGAGRSGGPSSRGDMAAMAGAPDVEGAGSGRFGRLDQVGAWLARHSPIPVLPGQRRALALQGRSIAEFHADKFVWFLIGLTLPTLLVTCLSVAVGPGPDPSLAAAALLGIVGWFVPDIALHRRRRNDRVDATDALFTFLDLVILERLANRSVPQALAAAAAHSDQPLFVHLRGALARAELQQQPPHHELTALAERLELPALADIADVLRLDETGAALTSALRARVMDLRDAHLAAESINAHAISERMTLAMTAPVLVFAAILLAPPLLRLLS